MADTILATLCVMFLVLSFWTILPLTLVVSWADGGTPRTSALTKIGPTGVNLSNDFDQI